MVYAWTLDGTRVKSLMDIHQRCRVLVVSRTKDFVGVRGLDQLEGFELMQLENAKKVQPKPGTWIQTAAVSWLHKNDTVDLKNNMDVSQGYMKVGGEEVNDVEESSQLIDAIRNEHARVYMQDQALLTMIRDRRPQLNFSNVLPAKQVISEEYTQETGIHES